MNLNEESLSLCQLPPILYAEASVSAISGWSLLTTTEPITADNVAKFYPQPELVNLAAQKLRNAGFQILEQGKLTISIAAPPVLYEQVFQTRLITQEKPVIKPGGLLETGTFIDASNTDIIGLIDPSASDLAGILAGIAINEPLYLLDHILPKYQPPSPPYWHLKVPDDVAEHLNAKAIQQKGFTGKGVRVVMVDTGWYNHPFFAKNNYYATVILGPDAIDPGSDAHGHGTGESANLFSIAPGVHLTMVKMATTKGTLVNTTAALKLAVALEPDIISCSWGGSAENLPLSAHQKVQSAIIADAVKRGIIVIFAGGNGNWCFPGQHPDVMAAGGVYVNPDRTLEASDYASGFVSKIYPGRSVPDVCGLVGKKPAAAYLMLPVPPGSAIDLNRGNPQLKHPQGDETDPNDGWAAFSGTSAAAPQLAGICALMKEANPNLSPPEVRSILQKTARDVVKGVSHALTGGHQAHPGVDVATGWGLADAFQATILAQKLGIKPNNELNNYLPKLEVFMDTELRKNYEKIKWELDKALQGVIPDDYELVITPANFVRRSAVSKAAYRLMKQLDEYAAIIKKVATDKEADKEKKKATLAHITLKKVKKAVSSAKGLLKMGRYSEAALDFLMAVMVVLEDELISITPKEKDDVEELLSSILETLGEIGDKEKCECQGEKGGSETLLSCDKTDKGCVYYKDGEIIYTQPLPCECR